MLQLLSDPDLAVRLAGAARELVDKEYGLEPMVRATEDVYRQVLGE
jgi:hypothetical protein